jgi:hypothetical protein
LQTQDNKTDANLNATLDLFMIFAPGPTTPGIKIITKVDMAYQVPQYLQPLLVFVPKVL